MDLATAQTHLYDALTQLAAARKAAAYSVGDRSKTNAQPEDLQRQVDYWQRVVNDYTAAGRGVRNTMAAVPRFR